MTDREEMKPVRPWNVVVLPDRIWARTEDEARSIFVKAVTDDPGLMRVSEANLCEADDVD